MTELGGVWKLIVGVLASDTLPAQVMPYCGEDGVPFGSSGSMTKLPLSCTLLGSVTPPRSVPPLMTRSPVTCVAGSVTYSVSPGLIVVCARASAGSARASAASGRTAPPERPRRRLVSGVATQAPSAAFH